MIRGLGRIATIRAGDACAVAIQNESRVNGRSFVVWEWIDAIIQVLVVDSGEGIGVEQELVSHLDV
jgi:hypothetical protein